MSDASGDGPAAALARLLARRLADRDRPPGASLTVAELHRQLLPYPRCREVAGLASKAEYDVAMLRLLDEPGLLTASDPELAEAVEREREAAEPGLGFLEDFAAAALRPGPKLTALVGTDVLADVSAGSEGSADTDAKAEGGGRTGGETLSMERAREEKRAGQEATGKRPEESRSPGEDSAPACRDCGQALPGQDELPFCPWCGADQSYRRCGACGETLEADWSYCPACGSRAGG